MHIGNEQLCIIHSDADDQFFLTVMCVLLFVLHVCMLRRCEVDDNACVGDG